MKFDRRKFMVFCVVVIFLLGVRGRTASYDVTLAVDEPDNSSEKLSTANLSGYSGDEETVSSTPTDGYSVPTLGEDQINLHDDPGLHQTVHAEPGERSSLKTAETQPDSTPSHSNWLWTNRNRQFHLCLSVGYHVDKQWLQ